MKRGVLVLALSGVLGAAAWAQAPPSAEQAPRAESIVQVRSEPPRVQAPAGGTARFTLVAVIQKGFHINSHQPREDYLIASRVELVEGPAFLLEKVDYPKGALKSFGFAPGEKLSVYEGTLKLPVRLRAKPVAAGTYPVRVAFHYQACNDQLCLRPAQREARLTVQILPPGAEKTAAR